MSAFLGPIHYWLYHKIQLQQDWVEEIITLAQSKYHIDLRKECDIRYGVSERRALEEVIDESNIHGWLQSQVTQVEYKLAYTVTSLIEAKAESLQELEALFKAKGQATRMALQDNLDAQQLYGVISDSLLDGMPCDHASSIISQNEKKVVWQRNKCVHQKYWEAVQGDVAHYYCLRDAWLSGFVESKGDTWGKIDEKTYWIQKGE
ncbi:hypothetical protein CS063_12280 [Sporanaerobium hydrogeniformans]|uniref:Uncharacterized protein n=1 Tax=Sporanaerobium hydrogeniformans TaxID=3072179 RepID=A0AC61DBG6_9FIRM|nr:hypothetical protein [Sporanaerobium hydrogeniformans]PHV70076.1 hypothetical protein CS063_12280 [Sporanaerobium hydrogeniformans]